MNKCYVKLPKLNALLRGTRQCYRMFEYHWTCAWRNLQLKYLPIESILSCFIWVLFYSIRKEWKKKKTLANISKLYLQLFFTTALVLVHYTATLQSFTQKNISLDFNKCCEAFSIDFEIWTIYNPKLQLANLPIHVGKNISCLLMFCFSLYAQRTKQIIVLTILYAGSYLCVFKDGNNVKTNTP